MRIYWLVILAIVACGSAQAQEAPVLAPTRDVTVSYDLTGANVASGPSWMTASWVKVTYADHNERVRLDFYAFPGSDTPFGSIIWDRPANHVWSLLPEQKSYYQLPAAGRPNPGLFLNDKMKFSRVGTMTIAGVACTNWQVSNGKGYKGSVCVTRDGVVLRATRNKPEAGRIEATAITFGTPPKDAFKVPPDLKLRPGMKVQPVE